MPCDARDPVKDPDRLTRNLLDRYGIVAALLVMIVVLTILRPAYFPTVGNLTNVARQISFNAMLALGQFIVILTAGIDLVCRLRRCAEHGDAGPGDPQRPAGRPVTAGRARRGDAGGLLNGLGLTRLRLPHPFIATLAMLNIARGITYLISDGVPISGLPPGLRWFGSSDIRLWGRATSSSRSPCR